ncbi:hypothetical protein D6D19_04163 [Aureobasidium pullulans]|uniref:Uncharacterized protein n=1 Tax=Aureobasidium pullulans TaxID=5580 RepID=A0A4V4IRT7_AURPU|nr:hypothetical protein D6D19_04163 [Aureobasidium pullulans]
MHPSARGPRKNASQPAMSNQQTVDIFELIRDSPSAIAMQEPIDTMPSDAWKSCCAYRFFFPQPQNLISPQTSGSAQQRPSNCKIIFNHSPLDFWRQFHQLHQDPGGPYYLSRHFRNTTKSFKSSFTPSRTTTSHFPGQDQAGQECLEMETEGCLERPRAANMGDEVAARPVESPMGLRNDGQSRRGFACRSESTSAVMHMGAPVLGTVPLLIARPAQPQTMFLDRFSSVESLIGGRGILQDLSKTFEHRKAAIAQ